MSDVEYLVKCPTCQQVVRVTVGEKLLRSEVVVEVDGKKVMGYMCDCQVKRKK